MQVTGNPDSKVAYIKGPGVLSPNKKRCGKEAQGWSIWHGYEGLRSYPHSLLLHLPPHVGLVLAGFLLVPIWLPLPQESHPGMTTYNERRETLPPVHLFLRRKITFPRMDPLHISLAPTGQSPAPGKWDYLDWLGCSGPGLGLGLKYRPLGGGWIPSTKPGLCRRGGREQWLLGSRQPWLCPLPFTNGETEAKKAK